MLAVHLDVAGQELVDEVSPSSSLPEVNGIEAKGLHEVEVVGESLHGGPIPGRAGDDMSRLRHSRNIDHGGLYRGAILSPTPPLHPEGKRSIPDRLTV